MAISFTETAATRVREQLVQRGSGVPLRLGVEHSGCSGWKYIVDYGDKIAPDDQLFEVAGLSIVIDPKSLPLLAGSRIDLVMDGLNEKFVFDNPNAASSCGCGESFTV
jgi:iron-sulfur cluster assembly protein